MVRFWQRLKRNERGATAIEYGLIVGIVSIGLLLSTQFLADELAVMWNGIVSSVTST